MDFGPNFEGEQPCSKVDADLFFPNPSDRASVNKAKGICNGCKFLEPCLQYAVRHPNLDGIWGATTPRQRESMRSRMRREKAYR